MIIGVCGLAGAGKDTIADYLSGSFKFQKVAFADPLKRICRDVYDFTDEQLWGPSEKRNEPDKRYPTGRFAGLAWMCTECTVAFHGKPFEEKALGLVGEGKKCFACEELTPRADLHYVGAPEYLTPRFALQQLGTEWGRDCYPNTWVDYALRVAKKILRTDYTQNEAVWRYDYSRGLYRSDRNWWSTQRSHSARQAADYNDIPRGVVISDVRFHNEVAAIHAAGGYVWHVTRPVPGLEGAAGTHRSETEQAGINPELFSFHLRNDGLLNDLGCMVGKCLEEQLRLHAQK